MLILFVQMVLFCNGNMQRLVTVGSGDINSSRTRNIKDFISVKRKFFLLEYNVLFMVVIL